MLFDTLGDEAGIGEKAETEHSVGNDEADGIDGIVLDREATDLEVVDDEILSGLEGDPIGVPYIGFLDDIGSFRGGVEGDGIFFDETFQAAHVVAVFVGEEDGGNGCGIDADGIESNAKLFRGESGIDQDAGGAAFDDGGVAGGAGA